MGFFPRKKNAVAHKRLKNISFIVFFSQLVGHRAGCGLVGNLFFKELLKYIHFNRNIKLFQWFID